MIIFEEFTGKEERGLTIIYFYIRLSSSLWVESCFLSACYQQTCLINVMLREQMDIQLVNGWILGLDGISSGS